MKRRMPRMSRSFIMQSLEDKLHRSDAAKGIMANELLEARLGMFCISHPASHTSHLTPHTSHLTPHTFLNRARLVAVAAAEAEAESVQSKMLEEKKR